MKLKMLIAALVVTAGLCSQSFGADCPPGGKCCRSLCGGLKAYFDCHFPPGPPLVIKPITWHRCRHGCK